MDYRFKFYGFLTFAIWPRSALPHGYVQFFRTGQTESFDIGLLRPDGAGRKFIASIKLEQDIIKHTRKYLDAMKAVGIQPPILIKVSFSAVRDYFMAVNSRFAPSGSSNPIEEDDLVLPGVFLETWNVNLGNLFSLYSRSLITM